MTNVEVMAKKLEAFAEKLIDSVESEGFLIAQEHGEWGIFVPTSPGKVLFMSWPDVMKMLVQCDFIGEKRPFNLEDN